MDPGVTPSRSWGRPSVPISADFGCVGAKPGLPVDMVPLSLDYPGGQRAVCPHWLQGPRRSVCPPSSPSIPQLRPSLVSVFQAKREWEGLEQRSREGLARCQKEAEARLRELQERVDSLPHQVGEGWGRGSPAHQAPGLPTHPACVADRGRL